MLRRAVWVFLGFALLIVNHWNFCSFVVTSSQPVLNWAWILRWTVLPLLGVAVGVIACSGIGRWAGGRLGVLQAYPLRRPVEIGLGFGLLLLLYAVATVMLGFGPMVLHTVWFLLSIIAGAELWCGRREWCRIPAPPSISLVVLLSVVGITSLVIALAPPTAWDPLAYHLKIPSEYLSAGRFVSIPWLMQSHWPHLLQLFYTFPLSFGPDNAAALVHWSACLLAAYLVYAFAKRVLSPKAAMFSVLLFVGQTAFLRYSGTPHADGVWTLFHFLGAICLCEWDQSHSKTWLALGGFFLALAASIKLLALAPATFYGIWVLARTRDRRVVWYAVPFLMVLPWYVWNAWETGNPFWPFFYRILGGAQHISEWGDRVMDFYKWSWKEWLVSFTGIYEPIYYLVSLAIAAGVGWFYRWKLPRPLFILWIPVPFFVPLFFRHQELWRFLLPMSPAMAMTIGWVASRWSDRGRWQTIAARAMFFVGIIPIFLYSARNAVYPVVGASSDPAVSPRDYYLARTLDFYPVYQKASALQQPGDRVLLLGEVRGYHLRADYLTGDPLNQGVVYYDGLADSSALYARLNELQITHVLLNEGNAWYWHNPRAYSRRTVAMVFGLIAQHGELVFREGAWSYYRLR